MGKRWLVLTSERLLSEMQQPVQAHMYEFTTRMFIINFRFNLQVCRIISQSRSEVQGPGERHCSDASNLLSERDECEETELSYVFQFTHFLSHRLQIDGSLYDDVA